METHPLAVSHAERWEVLQPVVCVSKLGNLLVLEGGAGLQQEEALAPDMARGVVDVKLIVLVLVEEGAPRLEDGKVIVIPEWRSLLL